MADLQSLLADLIAEGDDLDLVVSGSTESAWTTPTPAEGWSVGQQMAHLAWTDGVAAQAATDPDAFNSYLESVLASTPPERLGSLVDDAAAEVAQAPREDVLAQWRRGRAHLAGALGNVAEGQRVPWFGPPMSVASMATARLMETWAHGQDVADALGVERVPSARLRHIAHLGVRTRDFSFASNDLPAPTAEFRVELSAPDGSTWTWGPDDAEQSVTGPALDFCLLVTQRRHRDDLALVARGADAERWLSIAQAFAGPPGKGREPSYD